MKKTFESNFSGDWSSLCPYCGQPQLTHQTVYPEARYFHRMPCEPERDNIHKKQAKLVWSACVIVAIWTIGKYLFDKIPFVAELALMKDLKGSLPVKGKKV